MDREAALFDRELAAEHSATLEQALQSSREIGTAIGILVEQTNCSPEEAFRMLSQRSQQSNVKIRDLAREIVQRHR